MFVAVFIHTSNVYSPGDPTRTSNTERYFFFEWLSSGLHLFISPTFFVVGGFFTVFLLEKYGMKKFLVKRFCRVLLPIFFAFFSVLALEQYLRFLDAAGSDGSALSFLEFLTSETFREKLGNGYWLHIWFLVQLVLSFLVTVIAAFLMDRLPIDKEKLLSLMDRLGKIVTTGPAPTVTLILILSAAHFVLMGAVSLTPYPYSAVKIGFLGITSFYSFAFYFMFFFVGMWLFWSESLFNAVFKWERYLVVAGLICFAVQFYPHYFAPSGPMSNVFLFLNFIAKWTTILLVLKTFHLYFHDKNSRLLLLMSDATMTVFVFHHVFVYILGNMFVEIQLPVALEWIIIVSIAVGVSLFIHFFFVKPINIVRFIVNGQTEAPRSIAAK